MGRQWVRQQIKHNELEDFIEMVLVWIRHNRQKAAIIGGAIVLAAAVLALILYSVHAKTVDSWNKLSLAENLAYGGHPDEAIKQVEDLSSAYPTSKATGFGLLLAGDILYPRGQYQQALKYYQKILDQGPSKIVEPLALSDATMALEAAGSCKESMALAQRFLDTYPDHFLAPQVHLSLARCLEAIGQPADAKADYQKITLQYPGTSFADWAQKQIQAH